MTYLTRTMTVAASHTAVGAGADTVRRLWTRMRQRVMMDRQRRELNQLSDHLLKDIGLSRADIDSIAMHLADGRSDPTRRPRRT